MADALEEELAEGLVKAGGDNIDLTSEADRERAMRNVAHPIAEAIRKGSRLEFKGFRTAYQVNQLADKSIGDIYVCTTPGVLQGESPLPVKANTAVMWGGSSWMPFMEIDLSAYYTKDEMDAAVLSLNAAIESETVARSESDTSLRTAIDTHASRTDNPHNVTAAQVGAYGTDDVDALLSAETSARENADSLIGEALADEIADRENADGEIITSLSDETQARRVNDDLIAQQLEEVAKQTDWNETDAASFAFLKNKPTAISTADIEALFV